MPQYKRKLKKGIRWYYKFDYNNTTYFSKLIYLSQKDAKKAETKRYDEVSQIVSNEDKKPAMSLLELMESRLDFLKVKKSDGYYKANKAYYKLLLEKFGDCDIKTIVKKDINTYLLNKSEEYQRRGKDNYRVNAMLRSYKALFNYAIQQLDIAMINPCTGIALYSVKKKLKYIPTDTEILQVMEICDNEQQALISFVQDSGARISEALRFKDTDVFEKDVILYTRKTKNSDLVPRKVPKPTVLDSMLPLKANYNIFSRWKGYPRFLEKKVKELKHPRKWNWHNLRHRFASIHSKKGTPLFELMKLLGHENLETTQNYLQLLN